MGRKCIWHTIKIFLDFSFIVQVLLPAAWTVTVEEAINEVYTDAQVEGKACLHEAFHKTLEKERYYFNRYVFGTQTPCTAIHHSLNNLVSVGRKATTYRSKYLQKIEFMYFYKCRCPNNS